MRRSESESGRLDGRLEADGFPAAHGPTLLARLLMGIVRGYQVGLSGFLPPRCRYVPSCSAYALEALRLHGAARGGWLACRRICRCHPWGGHGFDPVPPAKASDARQIE